MKTLTLLAFLGALGACVSVNAAQTFETTRQFRLPDVGAVAAVANDESSRTITAVGAAGELSFGQSILDEVDELRARDHVDSVEATVRVVSIRLSTDTTFAGVTAIRVQLITGAEVLELCNLTLSADQQNASSVDCEADRIVGESALQSAASTPAQLGAQLVVSGSITATTLDSVVTFEVEQNIGASL